MSSTENISIEDSNESKEEEENQNEDSKDSQDISKVNLEVLYPLYPPIKDISFFDDSNKNNKILRIEKELPKLRREYLTLEQIEKKNYQMTEDFLQDLTKDPCPLPKQNIIDIISYFIRNSTLINKLESSYKWNNEEELTNLCNIIAKNLSYEKYNKGDILFKIGETGSKFYFILKGYISILKLKEIPKVYLSHYQYFNFCIKLLKSNEYYILEETLKKNSAKIPINSIEELKRLYIIIFKKKLYENICSNLIYNNTLLLDFFNTNEESLENYDIDLRELLSFEELGKMNDWKLYLIKKIKPTKDDTSYFDKYKEYITKKKDLIPLTYYIYDDFLYLGGGFYFGENALEKENIYTGGKRNATIRAETDIICGSMKEEDYLIFIEPKKRLEKMQEIKFIFNNFFFKGTSIFLFEKNYFHLFSNCEFKIGDVVFNTGEPLKDLIFIREGKVSIELNSSLINIQNLIKFLYEYLFTNQYFVKLNPIKQTKLINNETINTIKNYINEPLFQKLKGYSIKFNEQLNKKRRFKIATSGENDILGLEEIYLNIGCINRVTTVSKKLVCYQISEDHIEQILNTEREVTYPFIKASINKIISLIQRLQHIKEHYIQNLFLKYEKNVDMDINEQNDEKNNISNNLGSKISNIQININNINNEVEKYNNEYIAKNNSNIKYNFLETKANIDSTLNNSSKNQKQSQKSDSKSLNHVNSKLSDKRTSLINLKRTNNNNFNRNNINIKLFDTNKSKTRDNFDYNYKYNLKNLKIKIKGKTNPKMKYFNFNERNKKNILIGDKNISIDKLRNKFKEIPLLSQENTDLIQIIQSTKYSNFFNNDSDNKAKEEADKTSLLKGSSDYLKYHLSYVPLSNINKRNSTINQNLFKTESTTSNMMTPFQLTIFSNNSVGDNNKKNKFENSNYNPLKTDYTISNNNQIIQKEDEINISNKKRFSNNNNNTTYSSHIPKMFNLKSKEKIKGHINDKIKQFYNDIKSKGYLSLVHNTENNTFFTRKYNPKYISALKTNKFYMNNASQTEFEKHTKFLPAIYN